MRMKSLIKLGAVATVGLPLVFANVGCSNGQKVYSVDSVSVSRSGPPSYDVTLTATGQTRTDGWTGLRLSPRGFNDVTGEYLFELRGDSPEGVGASVITPMTATFKIIGGPMNLKSIKVRAETNSITQTTFSAAPAEAVEAPTPAVSNEPAVSEEPAPGVVGPKPQFEKKEKPAPKPEPAPETPDDLEDALEK